MRMLNLSDIAQAGSLTETERNRNSAGGQSGKSGLTGHSEWRIYSGYESALNVSRASRPCLIDLGTGETPMIRKAPINCPGPTAWPSG